MELCLLQVNFGDVRIPQGFDYPKPQKLAALSGVHGVSSEPIVVVDAQTLLIPSFSYDGEAPGKHALAEAIISIFFDGSVDEILCRRREILGGSWSVAVAARYSRAGREWKGETSAPVRSQSYRAHFAGGPDDPPDRPLRRLVRGLHRRLWPRANSAES